MSLNQIYFLLYIFIFVFQSQKLHVQTKGGKVICLGTVYGNINIHASDKSVRLKLFVCLFVFSNYSFVSNWLTQLVGRFYKLCGITFPLLNAF